jgi:predicted chitinase
MSVRILSRVLITLLFVISFTLTIFSTLPDLLRRPAQAFEATPPVPTLAYSAGSQSVLGPNWQQIQFSTLPAIADKGWIKLPPNIIKQLGYDPSRTWKSGQTPDQFIKLGDVQDAFHLEQFNLNQISALSHLAIDSLNLNDFGLSQWQTPKSLVEAIPALADLPLNRVQPLQELWNSTNGTGIEGRTIAQLVEQSPAFAAIPLQRLNLSQYGLNTIPKLTQTSLSQFKGWQQSFVEQVPGLNKVPFSQFPQPPATGVDLVAIADVVWGTKEHGDRAVKAESFVTGSGLKTGATAPVACEAGKPCSYLELSDVTQASSMHEKRWASGATQQVKGGYGFLAKVNGGREPTGRLVYGSAFKVVMTKADEAKGQADFGLYLRACVHGTIDLGCTPYFIGPIPWIPVKEKGLVIIAGKNAPPVKVPAEVQNQVDAIAQQYDGIANPGSSVSLDTCGGGTVSGEAVNRAIAAAPASDQPYAKKIIPLILADAKRYSVNDPAQVSYILATAQAETNFNPRNEDDDYSRSGACGNYCGRGLVQLTHHSNYDRASKAIGIDLVNHPELANRPDIASKIMVLGMRDGWFTTAGLGNYIRGGNANFYGARQIVNDGDRSGEIAGYAQQYYNAVRGTNLADLKSSPASGCTVAASGPTGQKIVQAAQQSIGESTAAGPGGGNVACAWEVNRVLAKAGIAPVDGSSVPNMVSVLESGRGQRLNASQAQPGDIVIAHDMEHVGICMNAGCSIVQSNSSSRRSFSWRSNQNFDGFYGGANHGIYRVK